MKKQLPKNVRQIGNVSDSSKIYVEDYVDTFFNQLCDKTDQMPIGAFLVGEKVQEEDQDLIYIYGAIQMCEVTVKGQDIQIQDAVWKNACEICKQYFENAEILGWFLSVSGQPSEATHNIKKIHKKFFSKEKSIFVLKNTLDREEQFYIHKYQELMECGGHYIYYEKNLEMQNYMIASRKNNNMTPSEPVEDRVTKNFRDSIKEKMEKNEERHGARLVYAASTFLVLVVFVIGITMINNYDKMQGVQQSLDIISKSVANKEGDEVMETGGEIVKEDKEKEAVESDGERENIEETILEDDVYVVEKGDTLATISRKVYGDISHVEAICKMNGLEDGNLIFIGQKLLLP